jgi:hypothetical protein
VVATHAVFVLEMAYYGFDGGPAPEGALDGGGQTAFLARNVNLERLLLRGVVPAIAGESSIVHRMMTRDAPSVRGT